MEGLPLPEQRRRARTLWYHDHGVHHTAENVYMGLAAQYQHARPVERALPIPHGEYDVPLDRRRRDVRRRRHRCSYDDNGQNGLYGDVILVNGRPWPVMKVERRKYRFRILNASIVPVLPLAARPAASR